MAAKTLCSHPNMVTSIVTMLSKGRILKSIMMNVSYVFWQCSATAEHILDIHHNRIKNFFAVDHCHNSNHHICIKNTNVLATIPHYYKRKIRESFEIEKHANNLNWDDGLKLKDTQNMSPSKTYC